MYSKKKILIPDWYKSPKYKWTHLHQIPPKKEKEQEVEDRRLYLPNFVPPDIRET